MNTKKRRRKLPLLASRVSEHRDLMKALLREVVQEVGERERTEFLARAEASARVAATVIRVGTTARIWSPAG